MRDISPDRTEQDRQDRMDRDRTEQDRMKQNQTEQDRTERALSEALGTLAGEVRAAPDAYRTARGEWLHRERRRRLVLAVLIAVVFTLATLIGLWVLNQVPSHPGVIFSDAHSALTGT